MENTSIKIQVHQYLIVIISVYMEVILVNAGFYKSVFLIKSNFVTVARFYTKAYIPDCAAFPRMSDQFSHNRCSDAFAPVFLSDRDTDLAVMGYFFDRKALTLL